MNWIEIEKLEDFDTLNELSWDHSFIRETYILSQEFVEADGGDINNGTDSNMILLVFFASGEKEYPIGIEFFFTDVEEATFIFKTEIFPELSRFGPYFELDLAGIIRSRGIKYRFIDESYAGDRMEYGKKDFYYNKTFFPNG